MPFRAWQHKPSGSVFVELATSSFMLAGSERTLQVASSLYHTVPCHLAWATLPSNQPGPCASICAMQSAACKQYRRDELERRCCFVHWLQAQVVRCVQEAHNLTMKTVPKYMKKTVPKHVTTLARFTSIRQLSLFGLDELEPGQVRCLACSGVRPAPEECIGTWYCAKTPQQDQPGHRMAGQMMTGHSATFAVTGVGPRVCQPVHRDC